MTRCKLLDQWFDAKSKELDEEENKQKKDLITGQKKWFYVRNQNFSGNCEEG